MNYWDAEGGIATTNTLNLVTPAANILFNEGSAQQFGVGLNWFPSATPGFHIKATYFTGEIERSGSAVLSGLVGSAPAGGIISTDFDGFEVSVRRDF